MEKAFKSASSSSVLLNSISHTYTLNSDLQASLCEGCMWPPCTLNPQCGQTPNKAFYCRAEPPKLGSHGKTTVWGKAWCNTVFYHPPLCISLCEGVLSSPLPGGGHLLNIKTLITWETAGDWICITHLTEITLIFHYFPSQICFTTIYHPQKQKSLCLVISSQFIALLEGHRSPQI